MVCTLLASASEGGQAFLIQPLLSRVLLRGSEAKGEQADERWLAPQRAAQAAAITSALASPAGPPTGPEGLRPFQGRTAPGDWAQQPVCRLLERTRTVLVRVDRALQPDEPKARAELERAAELQLRADRLLTAGGTDRVASGVTTQVVAAALSMEARARARTINLNSAWATLSWILAYALGLAALLATFRFVQGAITKRLIAQAMLDLQVEAVAHVLTLSAGQLLAGRRGDLLSRLSNDLGAAITGVFRPLTETLIQQPLRLLVLLAMAVVVSPQLSLMLVGLAVTVLVPVRLAGGLIQRSAMDRQTILGEVVEGYHQIFAGIRVIRALGREDHVRERFQQSTNAAYRANRRVILARAGARSGLGLINDITVPLVVAVGSWLVLQRAYGLDAGRFAVFAALVVMMYRPTKELALAWTTLQDAVPSVQRLDEVLTQTPAVVDGPEAAPLEELGAGIELDGVDFSYDGETPVLSGVSFKAPPGTTTAIVGHTGAGKSTLMDLIARHLDPTAGEVRVAGRDLRTVNLGSWLSRLAVVSQGTFLFNDTVRENIRYGRLDASDADVEEAARAARIHDEILTLPGGYDYVVGERGSKLSGGQVQRVTIARALIRRPQVLLLDEAMSALDTRTERLVQAALDELQQGCTTFAIAHRLSTVRDADQILVLQEGRIVERGTHAELLAQDGVYAGLILQLREDQPASGAAEVDPLPTGGPPAATNGAPDPS